jgi:hypothetical protein
MIEIDEVAFGKAANECGPALTSRLRLFLSEYLDALPRQEPGRDRIAVVVSRHGVGNAWILDPEQDRVMSASSWDEMEAEMQDDDGCCEPGFNPPFARAIIHCNLPRPAEPVEVSGIVEAVE